MFLGGLDEGTGLKCTSEKLLSIEAQNPTLRPRKSSQEDTEKTAPIAKWATEFILDMIPISEAQGLFWLL